MPEFTVLTQVQKNEVDPASGNVVEGWRIGYRDEQTKTVGSVFVPNELHDPASVEALILDQLHRIRGIHGLG